LSGGQWKRIDHPQSNTSAIMASMTPARWSGSGSTRTRTSTVFG
jgi:hypothetical protein